MKTKILYIICVVCMLASCNDFLDDQKPQATLTQDQVKDPKYIDDVLTSAYAGLVAIEAHRSHCGTMTPVLTMPTWVVLLSRTVNPSTAWRKVRVS